MTNKPTTLPVAEILYICHYRCSKCNHEFSFPNPYLLYRYESRTYKTKQGSRTRQVTTREGSGFAGLKREIHHAPVLGVAACENCFTTRYNPQGSLDLDPEPIDPNLIIPTPLSEF